MQHCFIQKALSRYPRIVHWGLAIGAVVFTLAVCEGAFRIGLSLFNPPMAAKVRKHIEIALREDTTSRYIPHPYLPYTRSDIAYEKDGLRIGKLFYGKVKRPDIIRVACLGGSTTMNQYPPLLKDDLERYSFGRDFEVMDFGCNGWTLMESAIHYMIRVADFLPDVVLVHHGMNDGVPRVWPDFRPDYSHYRISWRDQSDWLDRKIFTHSWMFAFLQVKRGVPRTALQNYTVLRCDSQEMHYTPAPGSLEIYESILRKLIHLVQSADARIVLAPMPYSRKRATPTYEPLIDEQNEAMRRVAREMHVSLAEAGFLLENRPGLFLDMVHVSERGNRIKSAVYAAAIGRELYPGSGDDFLPEIERVFQTADSSWKGRVLKIQWNIETLPAADYHVYLTDEIGGKPVFLGQTRNGEQKSLVWKAGSPDIAERFRIGPFPGRTYRFQIFAIPKNGSPPFWGPFSGEDKIMVAEM